MSWTTPIAIPTRGGESKQITYNNLPDEIKPFVKFYCGTPIDVADHNQQVQVPGVRLHNKRQMIHEYFVSIGRNYIMVDDDVSFYAFDENKKMRKAALDNFLKFEEFCQQGKQYGVVSTHPRGFAHVAPLVKPGQSKFVYHHVKNVEAMRYDLNDMFEDVEASLWCIQNRIPCVQTNLLLDVNKTGELSHGDQDARKEVILRFARDYPDAFKITLSKPSEFAGGKLIPYTVRIKWSAANRKEFSDARFE